MKFLFCECPVCEFSVVVEADGRPIYCYLCASDNGRDVQMQVRAAEPDDKPEGHDARKAAVA